MAQMKICQQPISPIALCTGSFFTLESSISKRNCPKKKDREVNEREMSHVNSKSMKKKFGEQKLTG